MPPDFGSLRPAFAPAVPLKIVPTEQALGEMLGGGGGDVTFAVIAMAADAHGAIDYLVLHENMPHPQWMTPNRVLRVQGA